jgi:hypothetical protein
MPLNDNTKKDLAEELLKRVELLEAAQLKEDATFSSDIETLTAVQRALATYPRLAIGVSSADPSATLELKSTTRGLLFPRMTTAQRDLIPTPKAGLVIYNTTTGVLNFHNGAAWGAV